MYYDKEESNYRVEDIARDKAMESKEGKLIDYKRMNAQRCFVNSLSENWSKVLILIPKNPLVPKFVI